MPRRRSKVRSVRDSLTAIPHCAPLLLLSGPHPLRWAAPRLGGLTAAPIFAVFGTV
ncbi:hypothetical protein LAWASA_2485 [Lawsonibacter asaccharolyticus]|nr:hypothetical protein LAWASA_2485 [Lawsonibacter asaccharolyticus]